MAHAVTFSLPKAEVLHTDLEFIVKRNGQAFGKLLVSKGAVVWRRRGKYWRGKKLSWLAFDGVMQERGRPEHRRRPGKKSKPRQTRKAILRLRRK
jgi:hypothetical protein